MNQTQLHDEEAVAAANERFYRALEANDSKAMSEVWSHADWVKCVHPGWDLLIGWEAVRASWEGIFAGGTRMRVAATEVEIKLEGDFAVVSCYENLAVFLDRTSAPVSARTTATNLFQRVDGEWKLIHHHASSVSDAPSVEEDEDPFEEEGRLRMDAQDVFAVARFAPDKLRKVNLFETRNFFCDVYGLEPGQEQKVHDHAVEDKLYFVLEGRGLFLIGQEEQELAANEIVLAPAGAPHGVRNTGDARLTLLVFMAPNPNFK